MSQLQQDGPMELAADVESYRFCGLGMSQSDARQAWRCVNRN
jgi:hypothetical protein